MGAMVESRRAMILVTHIPRDSSVKRRLWVKVKDGLATHSRHSVAPQLSPSLVLLPTCASLQASPDDTGLVEVLLSTK
jgi:hypothetical protein